MKKMLIAAIVLIICSITYGQKKLPDLPAATTATGTYLLYTHDGVDGHGLKKITKSDFLKDAGSFITDSAALETVIPLQSDTIPLFVFGGGGGNAGDTAAFTTSTIYGTFYNAGSDTLVVTELRCVMGHGVGTDTLEVAIYWDTNLNDGTPTALNTTALPILSTTSGTTDTSFNNAEIPPGVWVWCETPAVIAGRKPTMLIVQISGYKRNLSY